MVVAGGGSASDESASLALKDMQPAGSAGSRSMETPWLLQPPFATMKFSGSMQHSTCTPVSLLLTFILAYLARSGFPGCSSIQTDLSACLKQILRINVINGGWTSTHWRSVLVFASRG
jgi:hypothetical protein